MVKNGLSQTVFFRTVVTESSEEKLSKYFSFSFWKGLLDGLEPLVLLVFAVLDFQIQK